MNVTVNEQLEIVGRYALYGEIASSSVATVCFGRLLGSTGLSRAVAVKRLAPRLARDPRVRAVFLEEARLVSRIRHSNVVPTLDVVATEGQLLLVMEYVHGETLARLARTSRERRQRIPLPIALSIVVDILHGLHAAHDSKSESGTPTTIVHRAVCPENVLVGVDGSARVLDFGMGRAIERLERGEDDGVKRKLAYTAPEQLAEAPVTPATDIYAAAVVLWELLAGRRLFVRDDRASSVLLDKLMHGPIEPPSAHNPSLPDGLDAIVLCALGRRPASRFASARAMASAIEALGEIATATEVGDWVEGAAHEALRARSNGLVELEKASTKTRAASLSTYDVDVDLDDSVEAGPVSSEPPPMIAASDTYPVTDLRTLTFVRAGSMVPAGTRSSARRLPWRAAAGVALAAAIGVAGGQTLTWSLGRRVERPELGAVVAPPVTTACRAGMVEVPAASFVMGADDDLPFERPAHPVRLDSFCIDRLETTTRDYQACTDRGECAPPATANEWSGITDRERKSFDPLCNGRDPGGHATHAINCVDWEMASQACRARGARLPTEAEWELAARGTDGRVEDLIGNVSEWVADYYGDYPSDARSNPVGPVVGVERVVRGGAWNGSLSAWARPTFRSKAPPTKRSYAIGFRCASSR